MILDHVAMAERHIAEGEQHLRRQRQLVSSMKRRQPSLEILKQARSMLASMERMQRNHIATRDRLRRELDVPPV
jgi:hypothetical protein